MYKANILITLRPSILDPQGKATQRALGNLGFSSVEHVRMGKYIELWIDEKAEDAAAQVAREVCRKLLANEVIEDFSIQLERTEPQNA